MIIFFVCDCGVSGGGDLNPLESGQGTGYIPFIKAVP